jgi:hypothetical protein
MPQCGRLFSEFERMQGAMTLEGVLVRMKYESQQRSMGDLNFSKAIIDFKRQIMLGAHAILHDNIECELIPMSNISRISIPRGRNQYSTGEPHESEPEVEEVDVG